MWAEKLGDETFVTIVRPYVLHHRVGIARSSDIREPHPVLGCRVHADAADVLHDAKAKRIRIETAILAGIEHGLMRHIGMGLQELHEGAIGRSEKQQSELQSLMRISYAVFFLKKKK